MHDSSDEHMLERILAGNDDLAEHNREHFDELNLTAVNIMSAPGAGKTSLLECTVATLAPKHNIFVLEGDMVGNLDAERLRRVGASVFQICTGRSCHLDAQMVARFLHTEPLAGVELLLIENVGNLVCPADFKLGEHKRVVLLSVTEGDDKPIKYPVIFRSCDAVVFTKCDLLPYVDFDIERAIDNIRVLNEDVETFVVSSKDKTGLTEWNSWLSQKVGAKVASLES
ncbi:MAG: hydrogenase nickel incorporation protein HypB [Cyanobacteriota bacterium erpe_2018_sw_21hr_WHONDRS-SW48-000092_B_bin.40]|jgi:hydrogenase nickel incorporation protein HypB|nr:hydrogenase nickel incorporation protein HypB [Cyanobacteriota bacterium erpe_2018_sw_21hr_WHONDRS-SW48-000092_B_bin.40]